MPGASLQNRPPTDGQLKQVKRSMFGRPRKKKLYVLTGNLELSLLLTVVNPAGPQPELEVLASTETPLNTEVAMPRLLATAPSRRGNLAVVLPLHFFQTVPVTLPQMPEGALAKALPYHLAKAVPKPINEYIYDWQIAERQRDRLQLQVYLFPAATFAKMKEELARKRLEIQYFEADVFAACALLEHRRQLADEHATLVVLAWRNNISLAVYDKHQVAMVRTAQVAQPDPALLSDADQPALAPDSVLALAPGDSLPDAEATQLELTMDSPAVGPQVGDLQGPDLKSVPNQDPAVPDQDLPGAAPPDSEEVFLELETAVIPPSSPEPAPAAAAEPNSGELSGWDIFLETDDTSDTPDQPAPSSAPDAGAAAAPAGPQEAAAPAPGAPPTAASGDDSWDGYFQRLGLEIMRTRDYYTSVMKGRPIKTVIVGGAELFWDRLVEANQDSLGLTIQPLDPGAGTAGGDIAPLLQALALGAALR